MEDQLTDLFTQSEEGRRHVRFFASIPDALIPYMPGFWWNQDRLFQLDLPVTVLPMPSLSEFLDVPIWRSTTENGLFTTTGNQILRDPASFPSHWRRVLAADTTFPVVLFSRENRTILLDGYHRLLQSWHQREQEMRTRILEPAHLPALLEHDGFLGELNRISGCHPRFIEIARNVAIDLLWSDSEGDYPAWT